ncbi:MAG: ABC transporter permease [Ilumatobacter sp.]|uniref:ABC transporter permease n=1 Tax=Ilumatobacter sp. TaxID=1967498 RepID=UPI003C773CB6
MTAYIIRRLLIIIPTIFCAISFLFFLFYALPGDPATLIAGGADRNPNPIQIQQINERYGLNDPIFTQFVNYWKDVLTLDLGRSFQRNQDVIDILKERAPNSIRLGVWAFSLEVLVGISVGLFSAIRRYSLADKLTTIGTSVLSAVPVFVSGFILQYLFAVLPNKWGWPEWTQLRTSGISAPRTEETWLLFFIPSGPGQWRYLVLPTIALASVSLALAARMMRGSMLEVLNADYMRTAKAKGLNERQVISRHGLRNAMLPVITLLGLDLGAVLGSAVLTETVFNWPGLGSAIADAVTERDLPVVLGLTLAVVVVYAVVNLLVDISYAWFDPRVRVGGKEDA